MNTSTWKKPLIEEKRKMQPWITTQPGLAWYACPLTLESLTEEFDPIGLKEMDSVALLNRIDTKYVLSTTQLVTTLSALTDDYRILSVEGHRLNHYRTLYFDTPQFRLYNMHVNDRADRYKIRTREYSDSCKSFLEVKHKTPKDRTIKDRISTAMPLLQMNLEAEQWLREYIPIDCENLEPKLWNTFTRVTLVNKTNCERVTLDTDLTFYSADKKIKLDNIAIAEVKKDAANQDSPFMIQMRVQKIQPMGFSKYCMGVAMLYENVKKNALKPKMMWLNKLSNGVSNYERF